MSDTKISGNAQILYAKIKQHIEHGNLKERWYHDLELTRRTGIYQSQLDAAKSELSTSGLMILAPGEVQTKFILPTDEGS